MTEIIEKLLDIAELNAVTLSATPRRYAAFSLFDWLTVSRAGANQPLCKIIRDYVIGEGGSQVASVAGSPVRIPARSAALVNGTISHALDYDDTHFAHIGHLSVGIYPAALAAGEETGVTAAAVRDAFLVGAEGACRLGMVLGRGHYQRGFHQTATAGAFGATIAAGRIYGLSRKQMRHALSLVATRASGLKSQFGTMGKPFNAGVAASNGIEAAALARRGFTSCDDGIGGPQGFIETHADTPDLTGPLRDMPPSRFVFNDIKYKLHACCHGTHAMIEALRAGIRNHGLNAENVERIEVRTHPRWLRVCDIKEPRTGLEVKFSYVLLAAMVLSGLNTASEKTYIDALGDDPGLKRLARYAFVVGDERLSDAQAEVVVNTASGARYTLFHDLDAPVAPEILEASLRAKSEGLLDMAQASKLWNVMTDLDHLTARALGDLLRG